MNTNRLEDFINANREEFDNLEPSGKVWNDIEKNTRTPRRIAPIVYFLRVAAVVLVVIGFSVVLLKTGTFKNSRMAEQTDPEMVELIEAEAYYASQVNEKMEEIRKCYDIHPELKEEIEGDLSELQEMYNSLKSDLNENVAKRTVIEAMIENNRYRLKVVDEVLEQINC
jgi:membrane-associated HD superfamily phosphohydrolase